MKLSLGRRSEPRVDVTRIIVSSARSSEWRDEEIIATHLHDLGGGGDISRTHGVPGREDIVPIHVWMGLRQDAFGGLSQDDVAFEPEAVGPVRRQLDRVTWFDRSRPRRIHGCGQDGDDVDDGELIVIGVEWLECSIGPRSRKDGASDIGVPREALVKRDQFVASSLGEGGQECVVPNVRRKGLPFEVGQ